MYKKLKITKEIHESVDTLRIILAESERLKDTSKIISDQRNVIDTLSKENIYLYETVYLQDSTITTLEQRDTLRTIEIDILKSDNKKVKCKLFGSIGLNIAQVIALKFKK